MNLVLGKGKRGGVSRIDLTFDNVTEKRAALVKYASVLNYSTQGNPAAGPSGVIAPTLPPTPYVVKRLLDDGSRADEHTLVWLEDEIQRRKRAVKFANATYETEETRHLRLTQRSGARFAYAMKRVLCADETGTGKSWTALTVANQILKQIPTAKILIFTLKNLIVQWQQFASNKLLISEDIDIYTFTDPKLRKGKYLQVMQSNRPAIVIVNWEALISDTSELLSLPGRWHFIIGDEAHVLSNRKAKKVDVMRELLREHEGHLLFLTGTPIEKGPGDMWSLLNLLYPETFTSYWAFFNYFTSLDFDQYTGYSTVTGVKNRAILNDLIRPFYTRCTLEQIAPEINEPILVRESLRLSDAEYKIYRMIERGLLDKENILTRDDTSQLGRLVGARQATISSSLVSSENHPSTKLERLVIRLQSAEDAYHVVFCSFRAGCDFVKQKLVEAGIPCDLYYSGEDPETFRNFTKKLGARVLVATPESLGVGTDGLQIAKYLHYIDVPWSHRTWKQANARLVRIGAAHTAIIYHYVAEGTVDELVWTLIENKAETFNDVVVTRAWLDGKRKME